MRKYVERVLISINEMAIGNIGRKPHNFFHFNLNGVQLRSLLLKNDQNMIFEAFEILDSEHYISRVDTSDEKFVKIKILDIPKPEPGDIERITDLSIRRALLFSIYEEYRAKGTRLGGLVQLAKLAPILQVREKEVIRNADLLLNEYFIEYSYLDGGMYTCNLSDIGLSLCDDLNNLMDTFKMIQVTEEETMNESKIEESQNQDKSRKVFVVHGRNISARDAMYTFLRSIDLSPLEWGEGVNATAEGTPYVGGVVKKLFAIAQAVVVILSPDQISFLRDSYAGADDLDKRLSLLPRPNVILEAGLSMGLMPDRTIIIDLGEIGEISDLGGLHRIRLDDTTAKRQELLDRLETAGCAVNIKGKNDWQTAGNFDAARAPKTDYEEIKSELFQSLNLDVLPAKAISKKSHDDILNIGKLSDINEIILQAVSRAGSGKIIMDWIAEAAGTKHTVAQYNVNKLMAIGLINVINRVGAPPLYYLSEKGIAYVVENKLV